MQGRRRQRRRCNSGGTGTAVVVFNDDVAEAALVEDGGGVADEEAGRRVGGDRRARAARGARRHHMDRPHRSRKYILVILHPSIHHLIGSTMNTDLFISISAGSIVNRIVSLIRSVIFITPASLHVPVHDMYRQINN